MARQTVASLRERIDGLALAFFVVSGAVLDALAKLHPDGEDGISEMYDDVLGMIIGVSEWPEEIFGEEAVRQAVAAAHAVFGARADLDPKSDRR